ncbi:MAG: BatD family protein [Elusimicrobia bacterium]|nr:BatD family protein [Elusimicrobiota bacterium]
MKLWLGLALALCPASRALGQLSITAEVNKTQVALDDQLVLAVTISGGQASLPDPQLPPLANFSVYSSGRSQNISFVNGRVSSSVTHTFVLVPRAVGKGLILPITVSAQGATAHTDPIEIQVLPPSNAVPAAPAPAAQPGQAQAGPGPGRPAARPRPSGAAAGGAPDVLVTAELDKAKASVNEQVTLSVKFHAAVPLMGNPEYVPPKLEGFLSEDLPPLRHYNVVLKGRAYDVTEIKTALFPLQAGRLKIGNAVVRCQVQQDFNADPFSPDFFERFFSQGVAAPQSRTIASQPLVLEVAPLPAAGRPADFAGAVGRFSLAASVDKRRSKVGDAVNLAVTVQGTGNLKAIGEPALPSLASWRVFDPVTSVNQEKKGDLVQGSKVIRTVLVPRVSGDQTIPPIQFSYFDPARREYITLKSPPLTVSVAPGEPNATPAVGYVAPSAAAAPGLTRVNEDISYLQTRTQPPPFTRALESVASAGPIHAVPLLFFFWALGLAFFRERLASDPKGARFRGAWKTAMIRSKAAQHALDSREAAGLLTEALTGFLADKLSEPASGLTMRRVAELLQMRQPQLPAQEVERIRSLWEDLDSRRFAPPAAGSAGDGAAVRQELTDLLHSLEKELKR